MGGLNRCYQEKENNPERERERDGDAPSHKRKVGVNAVSLLLQPLNRGAWTVAIAAPAGVRQGPDAVYLAPALAYHHVRAGDWHPSFEIRFPFGGMSLFGCRLTFYVVHGLV